MTPLTAEPSGRYLTILSRKRGSSPNNPELRLGSTAWFHTDSSIRMPGRGGYNGPANGNTGWGGRGRGRGGFGRGRGRGGFTYTAMNSMQFEYGSMSVEDSAAEDSNAVATSASESRPASRNQTTAYVSTISNPPSFKPVFRPFQEKKPERPASPAHAGPSNYHSNGPRNGFVPAAGAATKHHAGIGAAGATVIGGRRMENHLSDGSLLKPVTFVKSSSSRIEPTMDPKQQEELSACLRCLHTYPADSSSQKQSKLSTINRARLLLLDSHRDPHRQLPLQSPS